MTISGDDTDQLDDHQGMAIDLADAFAEHDQAALAALDTAARAAQHAARTTLYEYVDSMWENAKRAGLNPATMPEWSVVAGLRDLTSALMDQAFQAQVAAGEDE
ncbi:hypothetical protein [Catellatospora sp. NPDC049133]|uniref:hypothetical protein n=1 Tax=Catellatospora sp. NPDC049133 TaxID=3155499 RepID=UPI0033E0DACC